MTGLEQLETVGRLKIAGNANLASLDGLEGLREVTNRLIIRRNSALKEIDALSGMNALTGVMIFENQSLSTKSARQGAAQFGAEQVRIAPHILANAGAQDAVCRLFKDRGAARVECQGGARSTLNIPRGNAAIDPGFDLNNCSVTREGQARRQVQCAGKVWGQLPDRCDIFVGDVWNTKVLWVLAQAGCEVLWGDIRIHFPMPAPHFEGLGNLRSVWGKLGTDMYHVNAILARAQTDPQGLDFSSFSGLRELQGSLIIAATAASDLSAFGELRVVDEDLLVLRNHHLSSTKGLKNLRYIGEILRVGMNPKLEGLDGFESLESVGRLDFYVNALLERLGPLDRLERIHSTASISNSPKLSESDVRDWLEGRVSDDGIELKSLGISSTYPLP